VPTATLVDLHDDASAISPSADSHVDHENENEGDPVQLLQQMFPSLDIDTIGVVFGHFGEVEAAVLALLEMTDDNAVVSSPSLNADEELALAISREQDDEIAASQRQAHETHTALPRRPSDPRRVRVSDPSMTAVNDGSKSSALSRLLAKAKKRVGQNDGMAAPLLTEYSSPVVCESLGAVEEPHVPLISSTRQPQSEAGYV